MKLRLMTDRKTQPVALAVETSGRAGSVAAGIGAKMLAEITFSGALKHSAELFTSTEKLLNQINAKIQDVEHIYIAAGPGSFTGVRIAVTMAKMLAFTTKASIVAVNTTEAIINNASVAIAEEKIPIERAAVIIDAKRGQFFTAVFTRQNDKWTPEGDVALLTADEFLARHAGGTEPIWLLGEGLVYYRDKFEAESVRFLDEKYWSGRASGVFAVGAEKAAAGDFADPESLVPLYFRQADAIEKRNRK